MPNDKIINALNKGINVVGNIANNITNFAGAYYYPNFLGRPIGLANPSSRNWIDGVKQSLKRNIGEYRMQSRERVSTPIGALADPEYNEKKGLPWFITDADRKRYYDYIDYISEAYFRGEKGILNFQNPHGIRELDTSELNANNSEVGIVQTISDWKVPNPSANSEDVWATSVINPNNYGERSNDTRLGAISNYYLIKTLESSQEFQKDLGYSQYVTPKDDTDITTSEMNGEADGAYSGARITRGVYSEFRPDGKFGISSGNTIINDVAAPNTMYIGDIIPWSTSDTVYDTRKIRNDLDRVQDIQKLKNQDSIDYIFLDKAQHTTLSHEYYPFGNYYSMTYSLGLIGASGSRTQRYIANSMLGYPLTDAKNDYSRILAGDSADDIILDAPKKYYVGNGTRGSNYLDKMTAATVDFVKFHGTKNKNIVRYEFNDAGNDNMWAASSIYQHREAEGNVLDAPAEMNDIGITNFNTGTEWGKYKLFDKDIIATKPDIINKTNELFMNNKIKTIIGRFHTDEIGTTVENRMDKGFIGSATSKYGISRGRNLLKANHGDIDANKVHGYSNPYCRVWTYHHEYGKVSDLIRPFTNVSSLDGTEISHYRTQGKITTDSEGKETSSWDSGQRRLEALGARIKSNKMVRFAPTRDGNEELKDQLKHLMFSIENLAWKDCADELSDDQRGPFGGRIMWFPPYGLEFNENVTTQWNEVEFIGRGEKIPTYINTNRGGVLNFDILVDHPSVVNSYAGKGIGGRGNGDVDDTSSYEQTLLRFFAGCEILGKTMNTYVTEQEPPKPAPPTLVTTEAPPVTTQELLTFYVFYPNNYSGIEDDPDYFAKYLLRGVGSGYAMENGTRVQVDITGDIATSGFGYEMRAKENVDPSDPYQPHYGGLNGTYRFPKDFNENTKGEKWPGGKKWCSYTEKGKCKDGRFIQNWGYRIDSTYKCQILKKNDGKNYTDYASFGMNSVQGYKNGIAVLTKQEATDNDFSFADVYSAIMDEGDDALNLIKDGYCKEENIKTIMEKLEALKTALSSTANKTTLSIKAEGYASSQGHKELNEKLSKDRGDNVIKWLKSSKRYATLFKDVTDKANSVPYDAGNQDVNSVEAKASRAAKITICFSTEELVSNVQSEDKSNINIKDNQMEEKMEEGAEHYNEVMANGTQEEKKEIHDKTVAEANEDPVSQRVMTAVEYNDRKKAQEEGEAKKGSNGVKAWSEIKASEKKDLGYGNEYQFFSELSKTDSFLHSKIVDKIKFFDPAFHSITPEGFQSRLTFLHQCTRQGSTSSWTDGGAIRSAANLAFGRPPILVLRIGDFYNTKIVITSMNIDFKTSDGISWDLNDEGIGIMPMYARVSINFNFYGGSDLGGPIARLQNAVSFNYYANTGVYDNRSEMVQYNDDGTLARVKQVDIK